MTFVQLCGFVTLAASVLPCQAESGLNIATFPMAGHTTQVRIEMPPTYRFDGYATIGPDMYFAGFTPDGTRAVVMRVTQTGPTTVSTQLQILESESGLRFFRSSNTNRSVRAIESRVLFPAVEGVSEMNAQAVVISYDTIGSSFAKAYFGSATATRSQSLAVIDGETAMYTAAGSPGRIYMHSTGSPSIQVREARGEYEGPMVFGLAGDLHAAGVRTDVSGTFRSLWHSQRDMSGVWIDTLVQSLRSISGQMSMTLNAQGQPLIAAAAHDVEGENDVLTIWAILGSAWTSRRLDPTMFGVGPVGVDIKAAADGTVYLAGPGRTVRDSATFVELDPNYAVRQVRVLLGEGELYNAFYIGFDVDGEGNVRVAYEDNGQPDGAAQPLIVNGGFEQASVDPNAGGTGSVDPGVAGITGWTVSSGDVDYIGSLWQAADGSRSVDLTGDIPAVIEQAVATIANQRYSLVFSIAGSVGGPPAVKTLRAFAGSVFDDFAFPTDGHTFASMGWTAFSLDFTAATSWTRIAFQSTTESGFGPALDHVRLVKVPPLICVPDFNQNGSVSVQDLFAFLAAYFNADPRADFNGVNGISVQDIFDFLAAYFAGCP